MHLLYTAEVGG